MNETREVAVSKLKSHPDNPRKIDDGGLRRLINSIKQNPDFFPARPIVCSDRTGELVVIAGNQRLRAAKRIGMKSVPVYVLSGITEEREKELMLLDNVHAGEFDINILKERFNRDIVSAMKIDIGGIEKKHKEAIEKASNDYNGSFPLAIVLHKRDYEAWKNIKKQIKQESDTSAFLHVIKQFQDVD